MWHFTADSFQLLLSFVAKGSPLLLIEDATIGPCGLTVVFFNPFLLDCCILLCDPVHVVWAVYMFLDCATCFAGAYPHDTWKKIVSELGFGHRWTSLDRWKARFDILIASWTCSKKSWPWKTTLRWVSDKNCEMRQFLEFVTACPRLPHGGLAVKTNVAQIIPSFFIGNRDTHDITMIVHKNMKCAANCISAALGLFFPSESLLDFGTTVSQSKPEQRSSSRRDRRGASAAKGQLATCSHLHQWV